MCISLIMIRPYWPLLDDDVEISIFILKFSVDDVDDETSICQFGKYFL